MDALIYDGPETLGFRQVPDPEPAAGDHLIRVEAVGICGSDINLSLAKELEVERQERTMAEKECDELKNELKSKAEESKKTKAEQFDKFMSAMKQAFDQ